MNSKTPDESTVLETARLAACLILENGGETFRAEETAVKICVAGNYIDSEIIALTTGIFITLVKNGTPCITQVKRIKKRSVDLRVLDEVNSISRNLNSGKIDFCEALDKLNFIKNRKHRKFHMLRYCIYSAFACSLFSLVYGGGFADCAVAFACGIILQLLSSSFSKINIYPFATAFFGSALVALIAVTVHYFNYVDTIDKIFIGAIIPLLPGLAMTNAIRDTIMGDLISGAARFTEALLTAVGIAAGAGIVFSLYMHLGGVL